MIDLYIFIALNILKKAIELIRLKIELYETTVPLLGVCVYLSLSLSLYIYKLIEIKVLNLYTHIHGSIIHNSQKKEVTHKSFDR